MTAEQILLVWFGFGLVLVWFGFGLVWFRLVLVWFGLVWFGLVWFWFGLVWFDLVLVWFGFVSLGFFWFGLVWFDLFGQMGSCARFRVVTFASPSLEESLAGLQGGGGGGGNVDTGSSFAEGKSLQVYTHHG